MGQRISEKLLEIALPKLAPHGFQYEEQKSKRSYWLFKRVTNGVDQYIQFDQSAGMPNTLRVTFKSSHDMVGIEGRHFVEGHDIWWTFHNVASLESVINELISIARTGGLHWFEVSERQIPKASELLAKQLLEDHDHLAKSFEHQYGIQYVDPSTLKVVEQILQESSSRAEHVDWDLILKASAYFGEMVQVNLKGEWRWREEASFVVLENIGGKPKLALYPLSFVTIFWANPYRRLQSMYNQLQRNVNKQE